MKEKNGSNNIRTDLFPTTIQAPLYPLCLFSLLKEVIENISTLYYTPTKTQEQDNKRFGLKS